MHNAYQLFKSKFQCRNEFIEKNRTYIFFGCWWRRQFRCLESPLFCVKTYASDLEKLFKLIWERYSRGEKSDHISALCKRPAVCWEFEERRKNLHKKNNFRHLQKICTTIMNSFSNLPHNYKSISTLFGFFFIVHIYEKKNYPFFCLKK